MARKKVDIAKIVAGITEAAVGAATRLALSEERSRKRVGRTARRIGQRGMVVAHDIAARDKRGNNRGRKRGKKALKSLT